MKNLIFQLLIICISVIYPGFAQAQSSMPDNWVDYASGEYDIIPNITYSKANNTELKLDLYLPRNRSVPSAALVLFHGGGWVGGAKERNVFQLLPYLSLGWAVINVEYRLAENSPAPAAVEDCRCALRWVVYNARRFNFDISRIVLTGGSAGGHLALTTGMLPAKTKFDRQCPTQGDDRWRNEKEPELRVSAIISWYGIADVADMLECPNAKHYAIEWFGSMDGRMELAKQISPITYVRPGLPLIISIHGDEDDIAPYSQVVRLHKELDKAGVPNKLITIKGAKHNGFSKQALIDSFAEIRDLLKQNNIIK
ncbi:MAG: alpha/beta hydrolase [Bacteroidetes bacterium]|nr:alpha/beta hydrolase [Bacteroidota bacterium]